MNRTLTIEIQDDQVYVGEDNSSGSLYILFPDARFEDQVGEIVTRYLMEVQK